MLWNAIEPKIACLTWFSGTNVPLLLVLRCFMVIVGWHETLLVVMGKEMAFFKRRLMMVGGRQTSWAVIREPLKRWLSCQLRTQERQYIHTQASSCFGPRKTVPENTIRTQPQQQVIRDILCWSKKKSVVPGEEGAQDLNHRHQARISYKVKHFIILSLQAPLLLVQHCLLAIRFKGSSSSPPPEIARFCGSSRFLFSSSRDLLFLPFLR